MVGRIQDEVAIITGSGNGIGQEVAYLFAEEGAKVVVSDVDDAGGKTTVEHIQSKGGNAFYIHCDISKEEDCIHLVQETVKHFGTIDILVNNAAIFVLKSVSQATKEDWERSFAVNVIGTALVTKHAIEVMKKNSPDRPNSRGSIVTFGSISSFIGQENLAVYSTTKAANLQMTRNLAIDLAPFKIRANAICPGSIKTEASLRHMRSLGQTEEEFFGAQANLNMMKRIGHTREAAYPVLFLASREASFITGASLLVDGGYTAW